MDMDQVELDAAYDQSFYAPLAHQIRARFASNSERAGAGSSYGVGLASTRWQQHGHVYPSSP
jgi:hypothetical protein